MSNLNYMLSSKNERDKFSLFENFNENYLDLVNELYFSTTENTNNNPQIVINNNIKNKNTKKNTNKNDKKKDKEAKNDNLQEDKNNSTLPFGDNSNKFHFTSLDLLLNPLRTPLPFEKWNPYEIALFESCICKFGKDFELFSLIIKTKSIGEIQEFYYSWEKSKYFKAWVATQIKKGKGINKLF